MGAFGPALALACRIVLAVVLAIAAVGKVVDRAALPERLRAMGIAPAWSGLLAVALPIAELAIAVALVAVPHSPLPAIAAIALLVAFSAFLIRTVGRGVPCACFGAVRTGSAATAADATARNGLLVALAVLATGGITHARPLGTVVDVAILGAVAAVAIVRLA